MLHFMFAGYTPAAQLYESAHSRIYRVRREADGQPLVLKMLRQPDPPEESRLRFRQEFELTRRAAGSGVIQVFDLLHERGFWGMVLEDIGSDSLADLKLVERLYLPDRAGLAEFFDLALALVKTLDRLHTHNIIHKNICPANILYNPHTRQTRLIDFGIATLLNEERQDFRSLHSLEGTLAYMSPEQTGRMNSNLDYRTDLYSQGATLFALLCGAPPFTAQDPLALVYQHLAAPAPDLQQLNPGVPPMLSRIVQTLLAKNPEDRYQTAQGLAFDLEHCRRQVEDGGSAAFDLRCRDISPVFQFPRKLYGRQVEENILLLALENIAGALDAPAGPTSAVRREAHLSMVLITGGAGIGKTRLVQEVFKPLTLWHGLYVAGKFKPLGHSTPYLAWMQAFQSLCNHLLSEKEENILAWRQRLRQALGSNAAPLAEMVPQLGLILGDPPRPFSGGLPGLPQAERPGVEEVSGAQAQEHSQRLIHNFLAVFQDHPLVIFLDDLQWADQASLDLLVALSQAADLPALLLIGAYRMVHAAHPLALAVEKIKAVTRPGARMQSLHIVALELETITQFLADALHTSLQEVSELAQVVLARTAGIPLFIRQFLHSLYQRGLLRFAHIEGQESQWQWDIDAICSENIADDVLELITEDVSHLPVGTQEALRAAACMGSLFDLGILAQVLQTPLPRLAEHALRAVQANLVFPMNYALFQTAITGGWEMDSQPKLELKFSHDRIQQGLYEAIPEQERRRNHWNIATVQWQRLQKADQHAPRQIFDVVYHFKRGWGAAPVDEGQRLAVAGLNLRAGRQAYRATAFSMALEYFSQGIELLEERDWDENYTLALELHQRGGRAALYGRQVEQGGHRVGAV